MEVKTGAQDRDKILAAVATIAETILKHTKLDAYADELLSCLGNAIEVSRAYLFENHRDEDGRHLTSQRYEWVAPGITPQIDSDELQNFSWNEAGFGRWVELMRQYQPVYGLVCEFPESERRILEAQDIRSIAVVPIFADDLWWGFIGFDDCHGMRNWTRTEIDALVAAANIVGAAIKRQKIETSLKQRECQQAVISSLGLEALTGMKLHPLFQRAAELVAEALGVEFCKVLELQPGNKVLLLKAGVGWKKGLVGYATVGTELESQAGFTLKSNHPVIVEDLRSETRFSGPLLLRDHGVVSGMSVVIQGTEQPWGVFGVHTRKPRIFTEDDINFIQAIANFMALAISREQTEKSLLESEARYRNVVDNLKEVVFQTDSEGRWTFLNQAWYEITGFSIDKSLGTSFLEYVHPDDREHSLEIFRPLMKGDKDFCRHEVRYLHKDGGFHWIEVFARLTLDNKNNLLGTTGTLSDITERKQSETAFQAIIKSTVWVTGEDFFTHVTQSLCEWLNAECAIISEIIRKGRVRALGMQLDGNIIEQYEYDLGGAPCGEVVNNGFQAYPEKISSLFPDDRDLLEIGAEGYVGVPLRDRHGRTVGILCVISRRKFELPPKTKEVLEIIAAKAAAEIERMHIEKSLQEEQNYSRQVIETARDAFVSMDAEGNVIDWNPCAEKMFGWRHEEIIGRSMAETIIPVELRESHTNKLKRYVNAPPAKAGGFGLRL